jgi:hypothetical protein
VLRFKKKTMENHSFDKIKFKFFVSKKELKSKNAFKVSSREAATFGS